MTTTNEPQPVGAIIAALTIPIRTRSEANQREHWAVKAKRVKQQRTATALFWQSGLKQAERIAIAQATDLPNTRLNVALWRIAPRALDDDNLVRSFKAVRDELCKQLCLDDRDQRIRFSYHQASRAPKEYAVQCIFTAGNPLDNKQDFR